jgi:hypothetical protein
VSSQAASQLRLTLVHGALRASPVTASPDDAGANLASMTRWFREFWTSGAPRIGDKGARGFSQWVAVQHGAGPAEESDPEEDAAPSEAPTGDWSGWVSMANAVRFSFWAPQRLHQR